MAAVELGVERFIAQHSISGLRVGVLTNYASVTCTGEHTVDVLSRAGAARLTIFGPEHGFWGDAQYMEHGATAPYRTIPIHEIYAGESGHYLFPSPTAIADLDLLVVDLQDVGARYYTFYASMLNCMEVAAAVSTPVMVLDRPNPINGITVEGSPTRSPFISFVGQYPLPNRHALTIGEIAQSFNDPIGCDLSVTWMKGWTRDMSWDDTGLTWINPSPNLAHVETAVVYPGMCLLEGTCLSEGRGTTRPFEVFGAPWLQGSEQEYADRLNERELAGVRFMPFVFEPQFEKHAGKRCYGARMIVIDRDAVRSLDAGAWSIKIAHDLVPEQFRWRETLYEFANCSAIDALTGGVAFRAIVDTNRELTPLLDRWHADAEQFTIDKHRMEHAEYAAPDRRKPVTPRSEAEGVDD
jgi:uncharacterized protein YbbC (DUF1343 family)